VKERKTQRYDETSLSLLCTLCQTDVDGGARDRPGER
jgi:hypothetical protein